MASTIPLERYAPGGDIFASLAQKYGPDAAERVYSAAQTGDRAAISDALATERFGGFRDDSTLSNFVKQITSDPLAAPLDSLNDQLQKGFSNVFRNPFVVGLVIVVVVLFFYRKKLL